MIVEQLMTTEVVTVATDTPLKEAAALMVRHRISGLPVVEGGRVLGVVSEADVIAKERGPEPEGDGLARLLGTNLELRAKAAARTAGQAMTSPARTIGPRRTVSEAAREMVDYGVNRLPVVGDDGELLGIVTRADLVRAFTRGDEEIEREIRDEVLRGVFWIDPETLHLSVADGSVAISGTVETRLVAELLPLLIGRVPGVVAVHERLRWRVDDRKVGAL